MDKATQSFQLDYGPPANLVKRPHLWRLTTGLLLQASAAPKKEQKLAWHDVVQFEWREGSLAHDLKQHLFLHLKTPLTVGQHRLKLLVGDDRNVGNVKP